MLRRYITGSDRGFTLPEMMIAMTLGLVLLTVMLTVIQKLTNALAWQQASSDVDLTGSRALLHLSRELRMSGFFAGALTEIDLQSTDVPDCGNPAGWPMRLHQSIEVYSVDDASGLDVSSLDCLPQRYLQSSSDLVAVQRVAAVAVESVTDNGAALLRDGYWYLRTSGQAPASFYRAIEADARSDDSSHSASGAYQYWRWSPALYYLRDYSATPGDDIPALCVKKLSRSGLRSQCLFEGVESLKVDLALDEDGDGKPDRVVDPRSGFNFGPATHAFLYLLIRSIEPLNLPDSDQTEYALGLRRMVLGGDGFLRRVFRVTVPLPNQRFQDSLL
ncbi:PilW family protein [Congregibacter sp.]|uniref:PilW family protein n=1 Tax=Congregibacter sp. TaxID=2744308 RepID=UPI003F6B50E7